jgi:hypothetical protein
MTTNYLVDINELAPPISIELAKKMFRETGHEIVNIKDLPEEVQKQLEENRKKAEENIAKEKKKFIW